MKKTTYLLLFGILFTFLSCGDNSTKKDEKKIKLHNKTEKPKTAKKNVGNEELIALGKKLFSDKTCTTCHLVDKKIIGPSIIDINKVYNEKSADLIDFLKGELDPIVDTNPVQVSIMKANLDGFVKDLTEKELNALKAYMLSVK